jgi:chemotaxis protein MotA
MVGLLEKHHHESLEPAHALQGMAEGLPAIGIVAAVLGVIKTMASVTEPPAVLGGMIGGALVGTFMGVFLSYCILSPMASKITSSYNEDAHFYETIRTVLISSLQGSSPQVSVEIGRSKIPGHFHVTFAELEAKLSS